MELMKYFSVTKDNNILIYPRSVSNVNNITTKLNKFKLLTWQTDPKLSNTLVIPVNISNVCKHLKGNIL